jgi:hypothetical protein
MSTEISMSTTQEQDIDIESMYQSIKPKAPDTSSVAHWLEPIFSHHQSNVLSTLINTKNSLTLKTL